MKNRIKQELKNQHLKQKDVYEFLEIPQQTFHNYCAFLREVPSDVIVTVADYLGVSPAWLAGYNVPKYPLTTQEIKIIEEAVDKRKNVDYVVEQLRNKGRLR